MYEGFTDRARKVLELANEEGRRFSQDYIGTEHILLGIIKEGSGVAATILRNLHVDPSKIRVEVEKLAKRGPDLVPWDKLPQAHAAKKVIEHAMEEARDLNHNYVGTEHLLLGLLREQEGVVGQVLSNCGLTLEDVRAQILSVLGHSLTAVEGDQRSGDPKVIPAAPPAVCPTCGRPYAAEWHWSPLKMLRRLFGRR